MGGMTQRPWTPTKRRGPIAAEFKGPGPACVALPSYIGRRTTESRSERAPAFSFGSRQNGKLESIGPGPGQYNITGMSAKGKDTPPALSLHSRPKDQKPENFPAPGDYNPDKAEKVIHDSAPKYTFGLKTNVDKPLDTPAPNVYKIAETLTADAPKYTFGTKVNVEKPDIVPAPNSYNVPRADNVLRRSLRYSFGRKTNSKNYSVTPAPNVYNIPSAVGDRGSPAYTISGRTKELLDERVKNPAPGQYNNVDPEFYKSHSPAYTMSGRINVPKDDKIPGPGVYSPEKVTLDAPPAHSFGIRHSPFSEHY
ncbi:outer dense fiber protein 3 isoform X5 [Diabrotica virgifera virgifera]|uniref:Outer dense fiber protein 3-like isoform X5 n=1 Tax=Diabrotica virgifera virgifera TaxID=50390 RepID=A0A6P7FFW7_DIAVI|nr:outer dense fiber protein 3 isoform X5 [Diabrotica virgifera virgifera]